MSDSERSDSGRGVLTIRVQCGPAFRLNAREALKRMAAEPMEGPSREIFLRLANALREAEFSEGDYSSWHGSGD